MTTRSQAIAQDVAALLRARNPLIWIVSREEARVEQYLFEAAAAAGYLPRTWDVGQGVANLSGALEREIGDTDPGDTLTAIRERSNGRGKERGLWIMRDLPVWLDGPSGASTMRQLRNLARSLPGVPRDNAQAIVVISPSSNVPAELSGHATVIEWPLPDRAEIASILDASIESLPEGIRADAAPNGTREAAIDAAVGLSGEEAQACFAKSLVQNRKIEPATISGEKKRIIAKSGVLEWLDPIEGGLSAVGGNEVMKGWLTQRKLAYSPAARAYGLPSPKGVLMVGVPGGGKTLTAKSLSGEWAVPLLKLDMGALKGKFVGQSEGNLRKALEVIGAVGRCIVLIDEIEKAVAGATQGAADGGVSADALGTLLSWMQDRKTEAFIMATANNVEALPPELLRKGRFDELFFVDLPNRVERLQILYAALRSHGRDLSGLKVEKLSDVVSATDGFTGSEIAALVPDAMFAAFADESRQITVGDLIAAAKTIVPLSKTAADKIAKLRDWAKGRARFASAPEVEDQQSNVRKLDIA